MTFFYHLIMWYFNYDRIAQITGNHSKICTDDVCPERFRDRLKLDHVTASLTITNINTTDSGPYYLQINNRNHEKMFNVSVHDAPAADQDEIKSVKEGESVTLGPEDIMWYFNNISIAEITGDQSKICTGIRCDNRAERFRGRLRLDHQTGSLTITNTRATDSGLYDVWISSKNRGGGGSYSVVVHGKSLFLKATQQAIAMVDIPSCSHHDLALNWTGYV
uniref:Immunoglobulin subtype domain-containing protein n=1 Tax=Sinocyclocheilus anshuiensis TaxID=1608454 RepID=A0A671R1A2_9TELE